MRGRHKKVDGRSGLLAAALNALCVVSVPLSAGAAPLPPPEVGLAAQADNGVEQIEAPTTMALASADLDSRLAEALLDDRVDRQDPEDDDEAKHRMLRTFVHALHTHTVQPVSWAGCRRLFPFRLRAFAGRAPPPV